MSPILAIILTLSLSGLSMQTPGRYVRKIEKIRVETEAEFRDPEHSPLRDKAPLFEGNNFYAPDIDFRVKAKFERTESAEPFVMPTSNPKRQKTYVKYGLLHFQLKGEDYTLSVYRSPELAKIPKYKDYLFLPFTDLTNGRETYGGGRYLDLTIPKGKKVILDFNLCYNPYCAYSDGWSCPVPPKENFLDTKVEAGVKDYP
jgi:uncharacterized protein (DUF1684 family)